MKALRGLVLFGALFTLAGCGLNQQNLDLLQGKPFEVMDSWPFAVPQFVESTDLRLDGHVPDDKGLPLEGEPPSSFIAPSSIRVLGEGNVGLAAGCIERLNGAINLQLYLGPEDELWKHPLGEPFAIDLARATTGFGIDSTLDPTQKQAVLAGQAFVGATVTGNVHVVFDRSDRCVDYNGYVHAEVLLKLILRKLEVIVQVF